MVAGAAGILLYLVTYAYFVVQHPTEKIIRMFYYGIVHF